MNELQRPETDAPVASEEVPTSPPAPAAAMVEIDDGTEFSGPLLRRIRESKGMSLKLVSEHTKISSGTLAALEEERYGDMPNARVYVRGFVRCLARELGLDADQVSRSYVPRWERWSETQGSVR